MTNRQATVAVPVLMVMAIHKERRKRKEAAFARYWKGRKMSDYSMQKRDELCRCCGFTPQEQAVFKAKAAGDSIVKIAMELHMAEATVNRRIQSVKRKIYRNR